MAAEKGGEIGFMQQGPPLSVVIPAHNAARTLERAMRSVFTQEFSPQEVIVVDDGSSDRTADLAASYGSSAVQVLRIEQCGGAAAARNHGINASRGELIAFLDADDEWDPGKLARQVALLRANPAMDFVSCGARLIAPDGQDCGNLYPGRPPAWGRQAWRVLLAYNFIATPSVVVRRKALAAAGPFDTTLKVGEDQDMWIRLAVAGEVGYVDEMLVRVHETPNSLSSGNFQDQLVYTLPMIRRHLERQRGKLTPGEADAILGDRLGRLGRSALGRGLRRDGASLIMGAVRLGNHPVRNLALLLRAAIPMGWLKRLLGR
jgi:glycosyltransferase involved in cell wall biosynthesis